VPEFKTLKIGLGELKPAPARGKAIEEPGFSRF